jgi:hypothetical protein
LLTGVETEMYRGDVANRLKPAPGGARAFCPVWVGPAPQRQEIHELDLASGRVRVVLVIAAAPHPPRTPATASGESFEGTD